MAKKVKTTLKLQIPAGKANPAPPVGTALGPQGLNIMEFCQKFNEATKAKASQNVSIPVDVIVYEDRTYDLKYHQPPAADLIKKTLGIEKGSGTTGKEKLGKLTKEQLKKIAEEKMDDLNARSIEAAMNIIAGTAKGMGVEVEKD